MDIKKIIIENAYEFEKDRFIIGLGNIDQIIAEINQALQLQQTGVMACFSEEQLSQINKYGKHQHNRGAMDLSYVSFEFWLK